MNKQIRQKKKSGRTRENRVEDDVERLRWEDKTVEEEMCSGGGVFMHACRAFLTNLSCV